jgi:hypothetical protein
MVSRVMKFVPTHCTSVKKLEYIKFIHSICIFRSDQGGSQILFSVKMNKKLSMLLLSLMIVNISVLTKVKATIFAVLLKIYKPYMLEGDFDKLGNMSATKVLHYFAQGKMETQEALPKFFRLELSTCSFKLTKDGKLCNTSSGMEACGHPNFVLCCTWAVTIPEFSKARKLSVD